MANIFKNIKPGHILLVIIVIILTISVVTQYANLDICSEGFVNCVTPSDPTTGYTYTTASTLTEDITTDTPISNVSCDSGYEGTVLASCRSEGGVVTLSGCSPIPSQQTCASVSGSLCDPHGVPRDPTTSCESATCTQEECCLTATCNTVDDISGFCGTREPKTNLSIGCSNEYQCLVDDCCQPLGSDTQASTDSSQETDSPETEDPDDSDQETGSLDCSSPPPNEPQGICTPDLSYDDSGIISNQCYTKYNSNGCNSMGDACVWTDKQDVGSYGILTGSNYDYMMYSLQKKQLGCNDFPDSDNEIGASKLSSYLPIMGLSMDGSIETAKFTPASGETQTTKPEWIDIMENGHYKDLLWYLYGDGNDWTSLTRSRAGSRRWSAKVETDSRIPESLRYSLSRQVQKCEDSWDVDELRDMYEHNGGRPIIGYDKTLGVICRNTPSRPLQDLDSSSRRFHVGEGCPGTTNEDNELISDPNSVVCPYDSECEWATGEGILSKIYTGVSTQLIDSGRCRLESCREHPACTSQYVGDKVRGTLYNMFDATLYSMGLS